MAVYCVDLQSFVVGMAVASEYHELTSDDDVTVDHGIVWVWMYGIRCKQTPNTSTHGHGGSQFIGMCSRCDVESQKEGYSA